MRAPRSLHPPIGFVAQLTNQAKPGEIDPTGIKAKPGETVTTGFETKPEKTVPVVLRSNHWQTVPVILRPNHWQTINLGFEAQPRNSRSSSSRARYRLHTTSPDLPIVRPPSIRHVQPSLVLYTRSPTPAMILIAARHVAPTTCTPWDKQIWFSTRNKYEGKTTELSRIRIPSSPSQWPITIKPRNWSLGFSISPGWVHW
jgi:hypothetical protein